MADLFENPLGLDGFEFIEFSAPEKGLLEPVFERMGFSRIARHRSKDVDLWRQGEINLIANYEPKSPAAYFGVCQWRACQPCSGGGQKTGLRARTGIGRRYQSLERRQPAA